ncbi:hypothetical protein FKQ60_09330 [Vibrio sp. A11]|uniref:hypothetical protein n=1 Tax=Vibrio sp. A11 TaxID=2591464 RepID=UPI001481D97D|nr:hypothetical protein [Vibrio sp. A11]NNN61051.1 hypothetical protein [Vibrio sp. A11]
MYRWRIIVLAFCFVAFPSLSATLNISLNGDEMLLRNAQQTSSTHLYTLSDWQVVSNLAPTTHWQPGMIMTAINKFELVGPGGKVDLPIKLVGIEYNTAGVSGLTREAIPIVTGTVCNNGTSFSGTSVSLSVFPNSLTSIGLSSESCFSNTSFLLSSNVQPFYFVRPIFYLDKDALVTAFEGLSDPIGGIYTGSIPVSLKYYYKSNGITTYRNIPMSSFSVQLEYSPEYLKEIIADSKKTIEPIYDTTNYTASGETQFSINVNGYFQSGIRMVFPNREYKMKRLIKDETFFKKSEINYYIRCPSCEVVSIVEDGQLTAQAAQPVERRVSTATNSFEYELLIGYEHVSAEELESGEHIDTFTVIFEEIL